MFLSNRDDMHHFTMPANLKKARESATPTLSSSAPFGPLRPQC